MNQYKLLEQKPPKSHKAHFHSLNLQWTHINTLNKSLQNHTKNPFQFTKFTMNTYQHWTKNSTKSHKKPISINKIPIPTFTRMKLKTTKKKKNHGDTHTFLFISAFLAMIAAESNLGTWSNSEASILGGQTWGFL